MEMILENLPMALCVLLGMGLILVEVFLPGFGLPGISGIALVGVGTIMAAMHFGTLTAVALLRDADKMRPAWADFQAIRDKLIELNAYPKTEAD